MASSRRRPGIWDGLYGPVEVRRVQPYQAVKEYVCPGCHQRIPTGMGHYVAVPRDAPDLRRHWHYACWDRRSGS
ncbi:unannotated protein [freshwater metagenome]|uniref:Unannotated protein n=1 Tax=freshwater metagenome TaxID=449393 RepID=A0A6J6F0K3_9ZZZZ|nr:hypothetical protein [Actinomycetota bacterium]